MEQIGWNMTTYMGMRASQEFELLSHNMANASTPGFKQELLHLWRLEDPNGPTDNLGQRPAYFLNVRSRDYTQGSLHATGNETDFALDGPGFFKVETPQGVRYTRNGLFRLTTDRQLATKEGYLVLGKSGPITLNSIDQNYYVDHGGRRPYGPVPGRPDRGGGFCQPPGFSPAGEKLLRRHPAIGAGNR